jgi:hypothetical protein
MTLSRLAQSPKMNPIDLPLTSNRECVATVWEAVQPRGFKIEEIEKVLGALRGTGRSTTGMNSLFNRNEDHVLANRLSTADYLGQMSADDYPDKLGFLFNEFAEPHAFLSLSAVQRAFRSLSQLVVSWTLFWPNVAKPKLDNVFWGIYRFLTRADGRAPNLERFEHYLGVISNRGALATL